MINRVYEPADPVKMCASITPTSRSGSAVPFEIRTCGRIGNFTGLHIHSATPICKNQAHKSCLLTLCSFTLQLVLPFERCKVFPVLCAQRSHLRRVDLAGAPEGIGVHSFKV